MTDTKQAAATRRAAASASAPCLVVCGNDPLVSRALAERLSSLSSADLAVTEPATATTATAGARRPATGSPAAAEERLEALNRQLVARLGDGSSLPPTPGAVYEEVSALADLVEAGAKAFAQRFFDPCRPVVWCDARHAHVLPFWRHVLGESRDLVVVLLAGRLSDAARRLAAHPRAERRAGLEALARQERWLRCALTGLVGLPVYVVSDAAADGEPGASLTDFLAAHGVLRGAGASANGHRRDYPTVNGNGNGNLNGNGRGSGKADGNGNGAARHDDHGAAGEHRGHGAAGEHRGHGAAGEHRGELLLPEMRQLDACVEAILGPNDVLLVEPGPESGWGAALLEEAAALEQALGGLEWAASVIEPLLDVHPRTNEDEQAQTPRTTQGEDRSTPEDGGPYPLNASQDLPAYHRWLRTRGFATNIGGVADAPVRQARTAPPSPLGQPLISVVVPVFRPERWTLERCVGSVLNQDLADWELVLCDDASGEAELTAYLASLPALDPRVKVTANAENGGIAAATNAALALAGGEFVAFLDQDDELVPYALATVARSAARQPDADVLYSDEDKVNHLGDRSDPFFKPEWSPDLLTSYAYLAHLTVIRRQLVEQVGGLRSAFDGSQDWDLALRATERARRVVHIADVLYHWRSLPSSAASGAGAKPWAFEAGRRVLEDTLVRRGEQGEVTQEPRFPGRYHVRRSFTAEPLVSIVIPFRDEPALLATCAASLRADPGYDRFELVLVDNGSELPETAELLERLSAEPGVRVVEAPGPFNWPAINNTAARQAAGDLLLFLNNDIEAEAGRWLHALVGHALRPEVGAVGGRLLYPDRTIQHAGVVVGLGGIAGHVLKNLPADQPGYASMAIQARNCSVVTGACMMTRREVFESVGGFDERLPVAFNDVDFCLKLREKGYLVVYEPLAELTHHESKSRGHTDDLVEGQRILERWGQAIAAGDPYVNEHLSHWRYWCPLSTVQEEERWNLYLAKHASTPSSSSSS